MRGIQKSLVILSLTTMVLVCFAFAMPLRVPHGPDPVIETKMHLEQVATAAEMYHLTYDSWPTALVQLYPEHNRNKIAFLPSGAGATNDAWGHALLYQSFDPVTGYGSVVSLGRDGQIGGSGKNGDIEKRFE